MKPPLERYIYSMYIIQLQLLKHTVCLEITKSSYRSQFYIRFMGPLMGSLFPQNYFLFNSIAT